MSPYVATRWYRPPELVLGSRNYDFTVDNWAAACIICEISDGQPLIPGQDDVDQLIQTIRLAGKLCKAHVRLFLTDTRFSGVILPSESNDVSAKQATLQILTRKYCRAGKMTESHVNLIESCLRMDPASRPHSYLCLEHACYGRIRADYAGINPPVFPPPGHASSDHLPQPIANTPSPPAAISKPVPIANPSNPKSRSSSTNATFGRGRLPPQIKVTDDDDDGSSGDEKPREVAGLRPRPVAEPVNNSSPPVINNNKATSPPGLSVIERMSMAVSGGKQTPNSIQPKTSKPFTSQSPVVKPVVSNSPPVVVASQAMSKPKTEEKPRHKSVVLRSRFLFRGSDSSNNDDSSKKPVASPPVVKPIAMFDNPINNGNQSDDSSEDGVVLGAGDGSYSYIRNIQPESPNSMADKFQTAESGKNKKKMPFMLSLFNREERPVPQRPADKLRFSFAAVGAGIRRRMSLTLESKRDDTPPTTASSVSYSTNKSRNGTPGNKSPRNDDDCVNDSDDSEDDEKTENSMSQMYASIPQTTPISDPILNMATRKADTTLNARTRAPFKSNNTGPSVSPSSTTSNDNANERLNVEPNSVMSPRNSMILIILV